MITDQRMPRVITGYLVKTLIEKRSQEKYHEDGLLTRSAKKWFTRNSINGETCTKDAKPSTITKFENVNCAEIGPTLIILKQGTRELQLW